MAAFPNQLPDLSIPYPPGHHQLILQLLLQFLLIRRFPGRPSNHHLVHDDPQCKYISLARVIGLKNSLRRHVKRCAYVDAVLETILGLYCKSKIRNLPLIPYPQDVSRFHVAVHYVVTGQVVVPFQDLPHDLNCIGLGQLLLLPDVFMEIPMRTVLQHQVVKVGCLDDLKQPQHILMD